ncbi:phytoene desaturase family protein [Lysobacter korlensis]|uniref:Phytoene desaturase family protein n=1 Tax=Lysobacter korlensis TaxID=553636 RepID=A0ABV6RTE2_9GAMM
MQSPNHDVVVLGGGHNGLTAAAYLAQAGRSVLVLEKLDGFGGAAVSAAPFPGVEARLSRYSYLVSLLPERIRTELGLRIELKRRRVSSYTPNPGGDGGLLIDTENPRTTSESFAALGAPSDAATWSAFYSRVGTLARALAPTLLEPLLTRREARTLVGDAAWNEFIDRPVGETIERSFSSDLVRGVVLTDALIGTFAPNIDDTLAGNRCFLYHVIGNGTGEWDVPVGGMGAVSGELARAARLAGAELVPGAEVTRVTPDGEVTYVVDGDERVAFGAHLLANVAPAVLDRLLGEPQADGPAPEGAQVKVNLLVSRLPRLKSGIDPAVAFAGTLHVHETWGELDAAFRSAAAGSIPDPLPCEVYCHTLSDPTILSPELAASGVHSLTVFGLHTPSRLNADRQELQRRVLASLDSVLAEPLESLVLPDTDGRPCIETKTTEDLEAALGLPGGNIFHGPLSWPFAPDDAPLATPAERWGVATRHPRVLLCGSGARRGGAVSGIGGHNAAMAVLETG